MNRYIKLVSIAALLVVAGCANIGGQAKPPAQPVRNLAQTPSCCSNVSALQYKALPANFIATFLLDEDGPVFEFDSGKSYVAAIALPDSNGPMLLQVDSLVRYFGSATKSELLYPVIKLLDAKFNPIATLDNLPFEYLRPVFKTNRLRVIITIDQDYAEAKYALIYTSDKRRQQALSSTSPVKLLRGSDYDTIIYGRPTQSKNRINFSSKGRIEVLAYPIAAS